MTVIKKLNIRRYGKFAGKVLTLSPGLNVVFGDNEAGKTTLQTFTYQMLVGFPNRRVKDDITFFPKDGDPSGVIVLADDAGRECSVERVWRQESVRGASLADMLHGADDVLLNGVFNIHHRDIQEFSLLEDDAQKDRVFSAGISGAGTPARVAMRDIATKAELLGGVRKRKGRIKELVASILSLEAELKDATQSMTTYPDLRAAVDELEDDLARLRVLEQTERAEQQRASKLADVQPTFNEWVTLQQQLEADHGTSVSESTLARARQLGDEVDALSSIAERLHQASRVLLADRDAVVLDERLWAQGDDVRALALSITGIEEKCRQRDVLTKEVATLETSVAGCKTSLGSMSLAEAEQLDVTIQLRGELDDFGVRLQQDAAAVQFAQKAANESQRDLDAAGEALAALPVVAVSEGSSPLADSLDAIDDLLTELRELEVEEAAVGSALPARNRAWAVGFAVASVLLVLAAIFGSVWMSLTFGLIAVAALSAAISESRSAKRVAGEREEQRKRIVERRLAIQRRAEPACVKASAQWPPTREELKSARRRASEAMLAASRAGEARDAHVSAKARVQQAERANNAAQGALAKELRRSSDTQDAWGIWQQRHGLPCTSPAIATQLVSEVVALQRSLAELRRKRDELETTTVELANWEDHAVDVLTLAGRRAFADVATEVRLTAEAVEAERARRADRGHKDRELDANGIEAKNAAIKLKECTAELASLFAEAGVTSLLDLTQLRKETEAREAAAAHCNTLEVTVRSRIGYGLDADDLLRELSRGSVAKWNELRIAAYDRLKEFESELVVLVEERTALRKTMSDLESTAQIASLDLQLAGLQHELLSAVEEWRTLELAHDLICTALQKYREERQPEVLKDATRFYRQATVGKYDAIQLDDESDDVVVREAATGIYWDLANLSSGTEEPLYLSMRMGLAAEFSRNRGPLPVLMDDVLVNLSRDRRLAMIRAIAEFAHDQQVIFFTCHDHILAEFQTLASPNVVLLDDELAAQTEEAA